MGAAGRDFHNFNTYFRDNENTRWWPSPPHRPRTSTVVATLPCSPVSCTRRDTHPPEEDLPPLIQRQKVDQVIFAYSDISHVELMHKASLVLAKRRGLPPDGQPILVLGRTCPSQRMRREHRFGQEPDHTKDLLHTEEPRPEWWRYRHPMPYGDLTKQTLQRFGTYEDLDKFDCTIEEREEYEPLIDNGIVVYAGVDYERSCGRRRRRRTSSSGTAATTTCRSTQQPAHRHRRSYAPRSRISYHPGEVNVRMADVIIINKVQTADRKDILAVSENVRGMNPRALIIEAASPISVERPEMIRGKRVLVVEDGPTVTHGGMAYGAGIIAAEDNGGMIIDPRPYAVGSIAETYSHYPHLREVLPAMGYREEQVRELEETINGADCDVVVSGTPVDLRRVIKVNKPIVRVRYEISEIGHPDLREIIEERIGILLAQCESDHCGIH